MKRTGSDDTLRCSFCHKSQDVVGKLISSPSDYPRAYICDECIAVCNSILEDDKTDQPSSSPHKLPKPLEVKEYLDCRYICEQDACWQVFGFDIHRHFPPVERMPVHLPNENYITYNAKANMSQVLSEEFLHKTMLTEWFVANQK